MSQATILVVDDSDLSRALISRLLESRGYRVLTAREGAEGAVVALREHPDVVVTDLEMPVMDGFQLARLLKSDPASSDIPLLILTSQTAASSRFWGLETGADAYLVKDELSDGLVPMVEALVAESAGRETVATTPPRTALEVLARVTRHLDARLLEAVVVNRLLETGMNVDSLLEASRSVFQAVSEFADVGLLAVAVDEGEECSVFLRAPHRVTAEQRDAVYRLLDVSSTTKVTLVEDALSEELGRIARLDDHVLLDLPLREARGALLIVPRRPLGPESRELSLLAAMESHLSLVLDNARLAQRLRELSMLDGLTKVLNRRTVNLRLSEEMERARRYDHPLCVLLCDLDAFKSINDTHGHAAGDEVLIAVSRVLEEHARASDLVGRYGGEEFLVILPETDLEAGIDAAERLRDSIDSVRIRVEGAGEIGVTTSIGAAGLAEAASGVSGDGLVAIADRRLYEAKAGGRNRVVPASGGERDAKQPRSALKSRASERV